MPEFRAKHKEAYVLLSEQQQRLPHTTRRHATTTIVQCPSATLKATTTTHTIHIEYKPYVLDVKAIFSFS